MSRDGSDAEPPAARPERAATGLLYAGADDGRTREDAEVRARIAERLRSSIPRPDPALASVAKRRFVEDAELRAASRAAARRRAASGRGDGRHRWALFAGLPLAVTLALGAGAARATMQSLPDSPAYAAKLAIEDGLQRLPASHGERALRALSFAERRLAELDDSLRAGKSPAVIDAVLANLETDLTLAASEAAEVSSGDAAPSRAYLAGAIDAQIAALDRRQRALADAGVPSVKRIDEDVTRRVAALSPDARGTPAVASSEVPTTAPPAPTPSLVVASPVAPTEPPRLIPTAEPSPAVGAPSPDVAPAPTAEPRRAPAVPSPRPAPRDLVDTHGAARPAPMPPPSSPAATTSIRAPQADATPKATSSPHPAPTMVRGATPSPKATRVSRRAPANASATARPTAESQ